MKIQTLALLILFTTGHGMHAAWMGHDDFEDGIILDSCRVDFPDEFGDTPLNDAIYKNDIQKVKQLIVSGANVNRQDKYGNTPLYNVQDCRGNLLLFTAGTDVRLQMHAANQKITPLLLAAGANVNLQNNCEEIALHVAAKYSAVETIILLLAHSADVNKSTKSGNTALHLAARFNTAAIQALLCAGAEIDKQDCFGDTPLHYASHYKKTEAVQFLIASGADIEIRNHDGYTAEELMNLPPVPFGALSHKKRKHDEVDAQSTNS